MRKLNYLLKISDSAEDRNFVLNQIFLHLALNYALKYLHRLF